MFLTRLTLSHFRNYRHLDLAFTRPLTLLQGQNAQGKTNLLEAVYYLATSKSCQARAEREVVGWSAAEEPIPYAQITGHVQRGEQELTLEILFTPRADGAGFTKQIRINGVARRALDLVGQLRAVLFRPEDIVLVSGGPGERRRYLDIALCQMDRAYCQHLSRYQKILAQRNSLLKQLREQGASPQAPATGTQIRFWDEQLVAHGAAVVARRYAFLAQLAPLAGRRHQELSTQRESLVLAYLPSFNPGHLSPEVFLRLKAGEGEPSPEETALASLTPDSIAQHFLAHLERRREREMAAGSTLYGPHRDDLRLLVNGRDLRSYGSRGQQRTAALALKLAEVEAMTQATGEAPILLLDDVMSELDALRRSTLLTALAQVNQTILTTTDWEDFTPEFRAQAQLLQVAGGAVQAPLAAHEEPANSGDAP